MNKDHIREGHTIHVNQKAFLETRKIYVPKHQTGNFIHDAVEGSSGLNGNINANVVENNDVGNRDRTLIDIEDVPINYAIREKYLNVNPICGFVSNNVSKQKENEANLVNFTDAAINPLMVVVNNEDANQQISAEGTANFEKSDNDESVYDDLIHPDSPSFVANSIPQEVAGSSDARINLYSAEQAGFDHAQSPFSSSESPIVKQHMKILSKFQADGDEDNAIEDSLSPKNQEINV